MFDSCMRRYYFHYYFSWGGWKTSAPGIVREAFKLKRLASLPLWRGQLVHYVTSKVLQSMKTKGRIPERDKVIGYTLERFQKQLAFSSARMYITEPKKRNNKLNIDWLALFEHEYGRRLDPVRLEKTKQECIQAMKSLFDSPMLRIIADTDPSGWIIEDLDHAEFSQNFEIEGVKVYVKTDFMFRKKDGTFNIVDWKTYGGTASVDEERQEPQDARVQLGVYGYYVSRIMGEPLHSIRLYEVNLLDGGNVTEYTVDEESIVTFSEHISTGISKLSSVLADGDTARNEPLPPEHFAKIENGNCRFCNFYRICKDEGYRDRLP